MRIISADELNRMKKSGAKARRRLGTATKKPEPVKKEEGLGLSGSDSTIQPPVPASSPVPDTKLYAAMAASIAASNASMEKLVLGNTAAIEAFRAQLAEQIKKSDVRVPWEHTVKRTDKGLINKIISIPQENLLKSS